MMSRRGKTPGKGFLASRWSLIVGTVVLFVLTIAFARAYYQNYRTREEIDRLKAEVSRLETKKIETFEILRYAQSAAYVEEKARTELNMVKPGERVTVVPGAAAGGAGGVGQPLKNMLESGNLSNPRRWWNYFFGD